MVAVGKNSGPSSSGGPQSQQIFCCAFNANGTVFVTGSSDKLARVHFNAPHMLIVVFYFFMYRPQKKQQQERGRFLLSLKKGDHVVTAGGIHGVIKLLRDKYVLLEISPKVVIKVDKAAIQSGDVKLVSEEEAKNAEKEETEPEEVTEDAPETADEAKKETANKEDKA